MRKAEGMEEECEHIRKLRQLLHLAGFKIWAEYGECGWVNVSGAACRTTFEVDLDPVTAEEER